jgi:streptogramin lyase
MSNFARIAFSIGAAVLFAGCGGSLPPRANSEPANYATRPLLTTADGERILRAREFSLPAGQVGSFSIITGSDHALWFTEIHAIGRMTTAGKVSEINLGSDDSDPGFLTIGPDQNVWASTAAYGGKLTGYQIFRITRNRELHITTLSADAFPSNLVTIEHQLYFGVDREVEVSGSDVYEDSVATISTKGDVKTLFQVNPSGFTPYFWLNGVSTPGKLMWLYSDEGTLSACSLDGSCKLSQTSYPEEYLDNLHPDSLAYSPHDNDVYVANAYTGSIYKFSIKDKLLKTYRNRYLAYGFDALNSYHGAIWVTLGGDRSSRPLIGRLGANGSFSLFALPFPKANAAVSAMTAGPDGHLWYLRGTKVGEILSRL